LAGFLYISFIGNLAYLSQSKAPCPLAPKNGGLISIAGKEFKKKNISQLQSIGADLCPQIIFNYGAWIQISTSSKQILRKNS
jgi:hypothetical protein